MPKHTTLMRILGLPIWVMCCACVGRGPWLAPEGWGMLSRFRGQVPPCSVPGNAKTVAFTFLRGLRRCASSRDWQHKLEGISIPWLRARKVSSRSIQASQSTHRIANSRWSRFGRMPLRRLLAKNGSSREAELVEAMENHHFEIFGNVSRS